MYASVQGPSVGAYITYQRQEDAMTAIKAVNNAFLDGRYLKYVLSLSLSVCVCVCVCVLSSLH